MNIVICGAGKIGETLCYELSSEKHDVMLIDKDPLRLQVLINNSDIVGVCGNAALYDVQKEAGVDQCDIFIACLPSDDVNIIAAITAKAFGAKRIIARVRDPEYTKQLDFFRERLGIDYIINPELETARDLARMVQLPEAVSVEHFNRGKLNIVNFTVPPASIITNMSLIEFRRTFPDLLVCIIKRGDQIIIPGGHNQLKPSDNVYLTGDLQSVRNLFVSIYKVKRRIKSVLIVGAGRITHYLIPRLERFGIRIKVIENNRTRCEQLAEQFPKIEIVHGDGTDQKTLMQEHAEAYDALISLTGIDEENIVLSMYADQLQMNKTIAKVNRINLLNVLSIQDTFSIVTPHQIISDKILRLIRSWQHTHFSNIEELYRLANGQVELLQFRAVDGCRIIGRCLKDLRLKSSTLVAVIVREGKLIFPTGDDLIQSEDVVLVVTAQQDIVELDNILAE